MARQHSVGLVTKELTFTVFLVLTPSTQKYEGKLRLVSDSQISCCGEATCGAQASIRTKDYT